VTYHLQLEAIVARADAGVPHGAPFAAHLRWVWQCHLHFWFYRLLAAVAALCSVAIVVAEATIAGVLPNLSVVSAALRSTAGARLVCRFSCTVISFCWALLSSCCTMVIWIAAVLRRTLN
jgi:hypothetical protein